MFNETSSSLCYELFGSNSIASTIWMMEICIIQIDWRLILKLDLWAGERPLVSYKLHNDISTLNIYRPEYFSSAWLENIGSTIFFSRAIVYQRYPRNQTRSLRSDESPLSCRLLRNKGTLTSLTFMCQVVRHVQAIVAAEASAMLSRQICQWMKRNK